MRRLGRSVAALLVVAAGVVLVWPGFAPADAPQAAGWWWKGQVSALVPVPKPPTVPEGGLYVAGDPSGPFGVAAIRFVAAEGSVVSRLTLRIASSQGMVAVQACPSQVTWTPEKGGPISSVPPHDCTAGAVPGALDPAGTAVVFEVGPLVQDGVLNVVLVPASGSTPFQAAFHPPGDDAVAVASESSTTETTTVVPPDYSFLEGPAFADTGGFVGVTPLTPSVVDTGPTVTTTPTTAAGRPAAPRRVVRPQPVAKATRDADRVVAALVLIALAGVFMFVAEKPGRMPRLVGPMGVLAGGRGGAPVQHASVLMVGRGVGRFRRPRTGPTPRL